MVWETNSQHPKPHNTVSPPNFLDWQSRNTAFSDMAYIVDVRNNLTGNGDPEEVVVQAVSANFFSVLGVNPLLGPGFTPENGQAGHDNVVILSYGLWKDRFAGDPAVVGKSILLNGKPRPSSASRPRISIGSSRMARSLAQSPACGRPSCFRNRSTIASRLAAS